VTDPSICGFAVVVDGGALRSRRFSFGTAEYPDRSTTLMRTCSIREPCVRLRLHGTQSVR